MSIRSGIRSFVEVDRLACTDQRDRIDEMQCALYHAYSLMDAISCDRIEGPDAKAASYFAASVLERIAEGQAEDAAKFMADFCGRIQQETNPWGAASKSEGKGDHHADHA